MEEDKIQEEAIKAQQNKSKLEKTISAGMYGNFELKKDEKNRFLGQFRERVLIALTFKQVEEPGTYPQVLENIKDKEAKKLIINRRINMERARDYIDLARKYDLSFKKVDSPDFSSDIGLVVVSDHAINEDDIFVKDRTTALQEKGIPLQLINAVGEKICDECYQLLKEKAPKEVSNYRRISWSDKLLGKKCAGHD